MRVAFYGRFSSEHQDESSITQQRRTCEERAKREGWTISLTYVDEAISGAKDERERPGYKAMLDAARAKEFDVLLINDLSRLSRDSVDSEMARRLFVFFDIRLIGVTDGIDTAQEGHELLAGFGGIMHQQFRKKLAKDIHRGMREQAANGFHCGGRSYGYKMESVYAPTTRPNEEPEKIGARLVIHPDQATWVKWIFERYAEGQSPSKIAAELNRRDVSPPGAHYDRKSGRSTTWSATVMQGDLRLGTGLLNNPLYRGLYIWNRYKPKINPLTKKQSRVLRDKSEWIEKPMPHLRIVSDDLWEKVRARRLAVGEAVANLRAALLRHGRSTGADPKYLFSGLLMCGVCRQRFIIVDATAYGCTSRRNRGEAVCSNDLKVSRKLVESLLLEAIQHDLFTDEGLAVFKQEFIRVLTEQRNTQTSNKAQTQARLVEVERNIARFVQAIKDGAPYDTMKGEWDKAEAEKARLLQTLKPPVKKVELLATALPNLVDRFRRMVDDLAKTTQYEVDKARGILKDLVGGSIVLHPTSAGTERFLTAELAGDYAGLFKLVCSPKNKYNLAEQFLF